MMDNLSSHQSTTNNPSKLDSFPSQDHSKKSLLFSLLNFPSSVFALFLTLLLTYSFFTILYFNFNPLFSIHTNIKLTYETQPNSLSSTPYMIFDLASKQNSSNVTPPKPKWVSQIPPWEARSRRFSKRVRHFFLNNSCKVRVFMTWVSPLESFGKREKFTIESLFKFNPNGCLLIVSESMDSDAGARVLNPFSRLGFRVMAVSPDYGFIFKNTMGAAWFDKLERGEVDHGKVSLGQNLSNLLRLCLLYKYGGIYMDTDFIVLKSLDKLKNSIGAQNIDPKTRKWSRLNNALLVFDMKHPLLSKFIDEFALTFNGNKWGHNGPYLVSRVVESLSRDIEAAGNFTILPPMAFYPVGWGRIRTVFEKPRDEVQLKQMKSKLKQIERESYALHLWNRQSKGIMVEDGSIISHLIEGYCVLCNSSTTKSYLS